MAEKIYVGRAKYIDTKFGALCKIWLTPEGVDLINQNVKNDGGINLTMTEMREPDRANNSHVLYVDDYVPNSNNGGGRTQHGRGQAPQRGQRQQSQGRAPQQQRPPARGGNGRNNGGFEEEQPPQDEHRYSDDDIPPDQNVDEMTDADIPF